ncbi:MAG: hypothetical protein R2701_00235 [Acidimicrobiales bacterium]
MLIEELVDEAFEPADLPAGGPVLIDEVEQPRDSIVARRRRRGRDLDGVEATQSGLDLAGRVQLVTDLRRQLRELVADLVEQERPGCDQGVSVFQDRFDLGDERVVGVEGLNRAELRFGLKRTRGRHGIDRVGLVETACPSLNRGPRRRHLAGVEAGGDERPRHVRPSFRSPRCRHVERRERSACR